MKTLAERFDFASDIIPFKNYLDNEREYTDKDFNYIDLLESDNMIIATYWNESLSRSAIENGFMPSVSRIRGTQNGASVYLIPLKYEDVVEIILRSISANK